MKRGDLVLLDYPFSDASGSKVRPALVVSNDRENQRLTNTIVALVTKNLSRSHEPTQILIDIATSEGRRSGLKRNSAIVCTNLFTISQTKIHCVVGNLPPALMAKVDVCLRTALALS